MFSASAVSSPGRASGSSSCNGGSRSSSPVRNPINNIPWGNNAAKKKTIYCHSYYETGGCPHGENCWFAHSEHEKVNRQTPAKYKEKLCYHYSNVYYCPFGTKCSFRHERPVALGNAKEGQKVLMDAVCYGYCRLLKSDPIWGMSQLSLEAEK